MHELSSLRRLLFSLLSLHFNSPLICSFLSPSSALIQRHLLLTTSQTNYPTNSLSLLLSQTFLKSFCFYILTFAVYLVFIWHFLKQMVQRLRNTFIHVSVNMSEVLCTWWGWIQHRLSQRNHTDPLCTGGDVQFLSGANRICGCCHSNELWASHFVSMRIFI